jgi:glucokinase
MTYVAGVDVGASTIRAGIADGEGRLLGQAGRSMPGGDAASALASIEQVLQNAIDDAGIERAVIERVGVGSMGPLDVQAGVVMDPPNVPGVDRLPVVDAVGGVVDAPVSLYNDAVAGVIGERFYGDGDRENVCYVTISTGIGVGAIVDGTVLQGGGGNAGELGHVQLVPDAAIECGCGGTGHWEALCAGGNLGDTVRWLAAESGIETSLDLSTVDAPALFEAAGKDLLADDILEQVARWNARGVATVVHAYDPETVHLGGGVAINNPDLVVEPIRERLPESVMTEPPRVDIATRGRNAVLCGAIAGALTA